MADIDWNRIWESLGSILPPPDNGTSGYFTGGPSDWDNSVWGGPQFPDYSPAPGLPEPAPVPPQPDSSADLPPIGPFDWPANDTDPPWSPYYKAFSPGWQLPETSQIDYGSQFIAKPAARSAWDDLTNNVPADYFNTHDDTNMKISAYLNSQDVPDAGEAQDRSAQAEERAGRVWQALIGGLYTPPPDIPPPLGPSW